MATNPYFNFYLQTNEQNLIEDLIVESIKIYAHDMKYLPREGVNKDDTLNEYEYSEFNKIYDCEFYIESTSSFEGQGLFMEKFGLQIKDQVSLTVSKRSFSQFITTNDSEIIRPREGDLIFIPMLEAVYEINFVDNSAAFYQLGKMQTYRITAELYENANDIFNTGVTLIDDVYNQLNDISNDPYNQAESFELNANNFLDFSESNPFKDGF